MRRRRRYRQQRWSGMPVLIIVGCVAALLAITYLALSFYFRSHFYFHTEINGLKVGGMTVEEATEKISADAEDYLLTVYDRDGEKYHVYGRDIDNSYVPDGSLEAALEQQNMFGWIPSIFRKNQIDVPTPMTYDEAKLDAAVAGLACFQEVNITPPENAYLVRQEDGYEVVPEVPGNQMILEKVTELVERAVTEGAGTLTLTDEAYVAPEITAETPALVAALDTVESYLNAGIVYEIADYDEKLEADAIFDMIEIQEDFTVTFREQKLADYAQYLASKYNTYGDVREFKTSSGDTIEIGGGDYGWIVNKEKEAEQIKADIMSGQVVTREPVYSQRAKVEGFEDIGNTYLEIDYTKQHMWYYEEGQLILESDVVTGNISKGNGSPDGLFKVVYKQSPAVLKGEDYESNVDYFIVFAYNVGVHDASWRTQFGGEYYRTGGSHGCVNAPGDIAAQLYDTIEVDTPVIAYYREPVELTAENCRIANAYSYVEPEEEETGADAQ